MSVYDPRIDAYIEKAAPFAQPVLNHLRALIHTTCTEVEETIKWGMPHFEYHGRTQFSMASFKQHCAFGFWLGSLMSDPKGLLQLEDKSAMGSLGRIESIKDLPSDKVMKEFIKQSMRLTDEGVRVKKEAKAPSAEMEVPDYFMAALKKNKKALAVFQQKFAPSHRKEYIEWLREAKREETRDKRMAEAIEWIAEGKSRHWKYQK